ncbi:MAG: HAD domain-containing protein [Gallionella sp.]|nr:HAD domain-containing protein [Gallionella sp.]MDP1940753.1 HAD domain-containing protein [Gallionella sp.]
MILFLDFDGVLHPEVIGAPDDFVCRMHLWKILRTCPDVNVVFSTSWREMHTVQELINFTTQGGGEDLTHRFIGSTPYIVHEPGAFLSSPYYRRERECRLWLTGNDHQQSSWLAVDDYARYFSPFLPALYAVDPQTGLTDKDAEKLIVRLKNDSLP